MLKVNNYRANKKFLFLFILLSLIVIILILKSIDLRQYVKSEIESYQKYNSGFSSTSGLYDDGSQTRLLNLSKAELLGTATRAISTIYNGNQSPPGVLGKIELFIKFKNLQKVYSDREAAIKLGVNRNPQEVPCKISDGIKVLHCQIKLKGDLKDHWGYKSRISLKVKVKDGYINGLKRFSIQKPRSRQFPYDQTFHELVSKMGSLSSDKQGFYSVSVNGESWGTMNVEPDIDQEFIEESDSKRLGVFRISNQNSWSYNAKFNGLNGYYISDPTITLSIKGSDKILTESPAHLEVYSYIKRMLRSKESDLFNRKIMIENLVLTMVWGSSHTLDNSNAFYTWNVYLKQLEPILTDQGPWAYLRTMEDFLSKFSELPFEHRVLFSASPLTAKELENALSKVENILKSNPPIMIVNELIKSYFPEDRKFSKEPLTNNVRLIRNNISQVIKHVNRSNLSSSPFPFSIREGSTNAGEQLSSLEVFHTVDGFSDGRIRINNLTNLELKVTNIKTAEFEYAHSQDIIIPPSAEENIAFFDIELSIAEKDLKKVVVRTEIGGQASEASVDRVLTATSNAEIFDRNIGCVMIHDKCFLPSSFQYRKTALFDRPVVIKAGSSIQLEKGANLLFLSGLEAVGKYQERITINGDKTGGIYVLNPLGNPSKMSYTTFEDLGAVQSPMYRLSGSVNGYGGKFQLDEVVFQSGEAEDQLNLVHAEVEIGRATFKAAKSDAFDCDFCSGDIRFLFFDDIGGDGLDISGSRLNIDQIKAENISDKALSVGEKSTIMVGDLSINEVSTGVAAKDGSSANIEHMKSGIVRYDALMTYIKKPFYSGVTKLIVNKFTSKTANVGNLCAREDGTNLRVAGQECQITDISVDDLYQGRMKK